jgi:lipopolysaccharide export system permease protein
MFKSEGFGFTKSNESAFSRGDRELSANAMKKVVDSLETVRDSIPVKFASNVIKDLRSLSSVRYRDTSFAMPPSHPDSIRNMTVQSTLQDSIVLMVKRTLSRVSESQNISASVQQVGKQIDSYDVEIFKKYSIPFACVVFVLVGAPLGYRVKRGGFGIAAGFSLLFFLLYWISLIGGEKLADRGLVTPFMGMWIANILIGIFGLYLMFKST